MKNPPHPPSKPPVKPLTAKRKKILELAMAQLRKTRAQADPTILKKIREIIAGNPKLMKGLGIDKMPAEKNVEVPTRKNKERHCTAPSGQSMDHTHKACDDEREKRKPLNKGEHNVEPAEKIDQAKNMEVMAKLMALKPSEIENIKAVLLKAKD